MKKSIVALALVAGVVAAGAESSEAQAARTVRLRGAVVREGAARASGLVRVVRRRARTVLSARFSRLRPRALYRVRWDAADRVAAEFVTDRHGRGRLDRTDVPSEAEAGTMSVRDSDDATVFSCSILRPAAVGRDVPTGRDPADSRDDTGAGGTDDRGTSTGGSDRNSTRR